MDLLREDPPAAASAHNSRSAWLRLPPLRGRRRANTPAAQLPALVASLLLPALVWMGCSSFACAHPISVVTAAAYITPDRVVMDIQIFAEDLAFYHNLEAHPGQGIPGADLTLAVEPHGQLLLKRLPLVLPDGSQLTGRVIKVDADEWPEFVPVGELMAYSLTYRLEWPLSTPPRFLTFAQRLVDSTAGFPALVDLQIKQRGREETANAVLKQGQVLTVEFDWQGAGTSATDELSPEQSLSEQSLIDREDWLRLRRDSALNGNRLNAIRSFLYIEPRGVRHELLIPFPVLESYITIDRHDPDRLTPEEQETARGKIADYFRDRNPLSIDQSVRRPESIRIEYFALDDRDLTVKSRQRTLNTLNSRVGVALHYPITEPARTVTLQWTAFTRQAMEIDAFCFAGEQVLRPHFSKSARSDSFTWTRSDQSVLTPNVDSAAHAKEPARETAVQPRHRATLPLLSLVVGALGLGSATLAMRRSRRLALGLCAATFWLAGAAAPWSMFRVTAPWDRKPCISPDTASAIFDSTIQSIYAAARTSDVEQSLDLLLDHVDARLSESLYLQIVKNVVMNEESDVAPAVEGVKVLSGSCLDSGSCSQFDYLGTWEVRSRTEHWGHVHDRVYRYQAVFGFHSCSTSQPAPRESQESNVWKVSRLTLNDARLVVDNALPTADELPPALRDEQRSGHF